MTFKTKKVMRQRVKKENESIELLFERSLTENLLGHVMLGELIKIKGKDIEEIASKVDDYDLMNDIINGNVKPTRKKLLAILFFLSYDVEIINQILIKFGYSILRAKDSFDCILIFANKHKYSFDKTEELLTRHHLTLHCD